MASRNAGPSSRTPSPPEDTAAALDQWYVRHADYERSDFSPVTRV